MDKLITYEAPEGATGIDDFTVYVRTAGQPWRELFVYEVKVDMHKVRLASMVYFDMEGTVQVRVETKQLIQEAVIRPLSAAVQYEQDTHRVMFTLDRPRKLSIEINGDRFANLHLFANPIESDAPDPHSENVVLLEPAIHRTDDIINRLLSAPGMEGSAAQDTIYFGPGMHYLEETLLRIPSGTTVYLAGGAVVVGSLVCERVRDVTIRGRGLLYLSDFHRYSAFRGIRITFSENISVEGITTLDPPHYSIYLGQSRHVRIRNFKSFSTRGWSDGIDMMACSHIDIGDIFLRTSDDCIAIYGSRWDFYGDSHHIQVRDSVLWADVAHPLMIGTHGNHHGDGDCIYEISYENIDILEHHEPQTNYMGALAINAGDMNTVRDVVYKDIRVENFELGRLIDLRVVWNKDYNPVPGRRIEHILFEDIYYRGDTRNPIQLFGYDEDRALVNVKFVRLTINGKRILEPEPELFQMNEYTSGVSFEA